MDTFEFALSSSLKWELSVRIYNLEGAEPPYRFSTLLEREDLRHTGSSLNPYSDLYVTVQVWAGNKPLTVPVQTSYKAFTSKREWDQWIKLPIKYSDLPSTACLAITIWDVSPAGGPDAQGHAIPFGGTTLPLFDADNQLKKGRQKCLVHRHKVADGTGNSTTPSILPKRGRRGEVTPVDKDVEELDRMEKLFKKHEMGEIPRVDWLDQLLFRTFEKKGIQAARSSVRGPPRPRPVGTSADGEGEAEDDPHARPGPSNFILNIDLARFDFPVVFADYEYPPPAVSSLQHSASSQSRVLRPPPPQVQYGPGITATPFDPDERLLRVYDPDASSRENPVEAMHRKLVRSQNHFGVLDKDLRPNAKLRDELNRISSLPPTYVLTPNDKDRIWKFRYSLTNNKRAVTKFVKSVNWNEAVEARQAEMVLSKWTQIDVDDALELLGPGFDHAAVRAYAVNRLRKADDAELELYLLQLVQAVKFERYSSSSSSTSSSADAGGDPPLPPAQDSSLARFLISRAADSLRLGNYFYWYLMVEIDDTDGLRGRERSETYKRVAYDFMAELVRRPGGREVRETLKRQAELVLILTKMAQDVSLAPDNVRKNEKAKEFLANPKNELTSFDPPLPLPLDPSVMVVGVLPERTSVFKSSLSPIKVVFKTTEGTEYPILFKAGDDLRQDQLVIQIITLMDQLLQKENLDLRLSPYKILATAATAGASQFVSSVSLQHIADRARRDNPVLEYLRAEQQHQGGADYRRQPMGLRPETLDNYVRSCAGYCVITYILGVGDRHLDNLLLTPDGHFFHIDFGYILGHDPKPFAPLVKLTKEMVDVMGGTESDQYRRFKQYCFLAYAALRKSSNLIINLFALMVEANVAAIKLEPDKAVEKVQERFKLEKTEEEAMQDLDRVIEISLNSLAPVIIDRVHGLVQKIRT